MIKKSKTVRLHLLKIRFVSFHLLQVTVETTEINFDTVGFIEPVTRTLTVANTGQVPVQFEFIKKLNDKSFCKPWLSVEPSSGFIMPGDKSDLNVEVYVDKKTAGTLNSGSDQVNVFMY